ncbi:hypothetical protein HanRHA438_Chr11g0501221 [Helianthus annuus]|nr:hypothetical protein HanRHA438_Chr11g0501221 [Helianthus annuus]
MKNVKQARPIKGSPAFYIYFFYLRTHGVKGFKEGELCDMWNTRQNRAWS